MGDSEPGNAGWRLLSVLVVALALGCAALSAAAAVLQGGGSRAARAMSPCTAYVVNSFSDTVTPILTATNRTGHSIRAGALPIAIAVTPDGSRALVLNEGSPGTVTPIMTATNRAGRPIRVGGAPEGIVITPDGRTAYVVIVSGMVVPIQISSGQPEHPIRVGPRHGGGGPYWLAITPDGGTVYVADEAKRTVTPISTATGTAGRPIRVGRSPDALAVTPNGKTLYVVNAGSGTVTPIHTATNTVGHKVRIGRGAYSLVVRPTGGSAYVINRLAGTVTRIRTRDNRAGAPVKVGPGPALMAITPDGKKAYVLHPDARGNRKLLRMVTPLRLGTTRAAKPVTARQPVTVAAGPVAAAITPDGKTAYVASAQSGTVTPIRTATNVAGKPIKVGMQPSAIAIACREQASSSR